MKFSLVLLASVALGLPTTSNNDYRSSVSQVWDIVDKYSTLGHAQLESRDLSDLDSDIKHRYLVTFRQNATQQEISQHFQDVDKWLSSGSNKRDLGFTQLIEGAFSSVSRNSHALNAFAATDSSPFDGYYGKFDNQTVAKVESSSIVDSVESDTIQTSPSFNGHTLSKEAVEEDKTQADKAAALNGFATVTLNKQFTKNWGLDRISHIENDIPEAAGGNYSLIPEMEYIYGPSKYDTVAYVLDTGVNVTNSGFGGRASEPVKFIEGEPPGDYSGHGTHVAGILGSSTFGVAKDAKIISVKVLNMGNAGPTSAAVAKRKKNQKKKAKKKAKAAAAKVNSDSRSSSEPSFTPPPTASSETTSMNASMALDDPRWVMVDQAGAMVMDLNKASGEFDDLDALISSGIANGSIGNDPVPVVDKGAKIEEVVEKVEPKAEEVTTEIEADTKGEDEEEVKEATAVDEEPEIKTDAVESAEAKQAEVESAAKEEFEVENTIIESVEPAKEVKAEPEVEEAKTEVEESKPTDNETEVAEIETKSEESVGESVKESVEETTEDNSKNFTESDQVLTDESTKPTEIEVANPESTDTLDTETAESEPARTEEPQTDETEVEPELETGVVADPIEENAAEVAEAIKVKDDESQVLSKDISEPVEEVASEPVEEEPVEEEPVEEEPVEEEPVEEVISEEPVEEVISEEPVEEVISEEPVEEVTSEEASEPVVEEATLHETPIEEAATGVESEEPIAEIESVTKEAEASAGIETETEATPAETESESTAPIAANEQVSEVAEVAEVSEKVTLIEEEAETVQSSETADNSPHNSGEPTPEPTETAEAIEIAEKEVASESAPMDKPETEEILESEPVDEAPVVTETASNIIDETEAPGQESEAAGESEAVEEPKAVEETREETPSESHETTEPVAEVAEKFVEPKVESEEVEQTEEVKETVPVVVTEETVSVEAVSESPTNPEKDEVSTEALVETSTEPSVPKINETEIVDVAVDESVQVADATADEAEVIEPVSVAQPVIKSALVQAGPEVESVTEVTAPEPEVETIGDKSSSESAVKVTPGIAAAVPAIAAAAVSAGAAVAAVPFSKNEPSVDSDAVQPVPPSSAGSERMVTAMSEPVTTDEASKANPEQTPRARNVSYGSIAEAESDAGSDVEVPSNQKAVSEHRGIFVWLYEVILAGIFSKLTSLFRRPEPSN